MTKQKQMALFMEAARYAQAFFSLYKDTITVQDYRHLRIAVQALKADKRLTNSMQLPFMYTNASNDLAHKIVALLQLPDYFTLLCTILIQRKRLGILDTVLQKIITLIEQHSGLLYCVVSSSHELSPNDIALFIDYFARITDKKIVYDTIIDPTLIAGVRIQSDTAVWESSVRKQLQQLELAVRKG